MTPRGPQRGGRPALTHGFAHHEEQADAGGQVELPARPPLLAGVGTGPPRVAVLPTPCAQLQAGLLPLRRAVPVLARSPRGAPAAQRGAGGTSASGLDPQRSPHGPTPLGTTTLPTPPAPPYPPVPSLRRCRFSSPAAILLRAGRRARCPRRWGQPAASARVKSRDSCANPGGRRDGRAGCKAPAEPAPGWAPSPASRGCCWGGNCSGTPAPSAPRSCTARPGAEGDGRSPCPLQRRTVTPRPALEPPRFPSGRAMDKPGPPSAAAPWVSSVNYPGANCTWGSALDAAPVSPWPL